MEKIIKIDGICTLANSDIKEINTLLNSGWTVKDMKITACENFITAIFVLEKQ